jgi:hypothetical protein
VKAPTPPAAAVAAPKVVEVTPSALPATGLDSSLLGLLGLFLAALGVATLRFAPRAQKR